MLTPSQHADAAALLRAAEHGRAPVDPLTRTHPGIDVADAYGIQLANVRRRTDDGAVVRGHKVGLSSEAMQRMMGVDEPDYGHLLSDMVLDPGVPVPAGRYCSPRVEAETGFVLASALPGESCTEEDVLDATAYVVPALELIDSRIKDWRIALPDTIADNASSAGVVLGSARARPGDVDLVDGPAVLRRSDGAEEHGTTGAVLGNPVTAVAWLARKVASFGVRLEAGHLILPGSCTRALDVRPGDSFEAAFAGLGSVSLRFT